MSFVEIVRPHRRDGRDVRAAIQKVSGGLRLSVRVPEMLVPVAGLRPNNPYRILFGTAEDFGRIALRPGGKTRLRLEGRTLFVATQMVPWEGGIRDREGRQMRLVPTRRRSTKCL
ncbi:MAG TPA: hypothetical protein ENJ62_06590, partial [Bryobacterales bacterium]|nr:hypothetical protein [Bryobacterales bacterium]